MEKQKVMSDSKSRGVTRREHLGFIAAGIGTAVVAGLSPRSSAAGGVATSTGSKSEAAVAIKAQCQKYLDAIYQGDSGLMDGLFHESALVYGNMGGEDWIGGGKGLADIIDNNPAGRESGMTGEIRILAIYGYSAAVEVVVRDYNGSGSTDFFAMQNVAGIWQVVGKSFSGA